MKATNSASTMARRAAEWRTKSRPGARRADGLVGLACAVGELAVDGRDDRRRDDERERVEREGHARPDDGDEPARNGRADGDAGGDGARDAPVGPGQVLGRREVRDRRAGGGHERDLGHRGEERERDQQPRLVHERDGDEEGGRGEVRDDHHAPAVEAVADPAAERHQDAVGGEGHEDGDRDPRRRPRAVVDRVGQRGVGGRRARGRDEARQRDALDRACAGPCAAPSPPPRWTG